MVIEITYHEIERHTPVASQCFVREDNAILRRDSFVVRQLNLRGLEQGVIKIKEDCTYLQCHKFKHSGVGGECARRSRCWGSRFLCSLANGAIDRSWMSIPLSCLSTCRSV